MYILRRKGSWMRHVIRGEGILTTVLESTVKGDNRLRRRRRRLSTVDDTNRRGSAKTQEKKRGPEAIGENSDANRQSL